VVGLEVVVGRRVVVLDVGVGPGIVVVGFGGTDGLGGRVPPFVGVSTWLPSQYIVRPSSERSFKTVLVPFVPGPLQYTEFTCPVFRGFGYSMRKTGFPEARNRS
jgi:hypothetical protein